MKKLGYAVDLHMTNTPRIDVVVVETDPQTGEERTRSFVICDAAARACLDGEGGMKMDKLNAHVEALMGSAPAPELPPEPEPAEPPKRPSWIKRLVK